MQGIGMPNLRFKGTFNYDVFDEMTSDEVNAALKKNGLTQVKETQKLGPKNFKARISCAGMGTLYCTVPDRFDKALKKDLKDSYVNWE